MSTTANRIAKNSGYLYLKMGITMFVSLYTTRLVLNALGASDFGIYSIVGGVIALFGFFRSSLASSTQRYMSYAEGQGDIEKKIYIFNISFFLHLALGLIMALALVIAGFIFFNGILNIPEGRENAAVIVYGTLIVSTTLTVMNVPYEAVLNSHENMLYFSIVGVIESFLKLAVAIVCVHTLMDKLIVYGILMAAIPLATLIIMRIYCHRHYNECCFPTHKYFDSSIAKEMTSFAGWGFLSSVAAMGTMHGLAILLNMFGGVIVNAAHGVANQLSGFLMTFSNNMLKALNPVMVKSYGSGQRQQMLRVSSTGNKISYSMFACFAIPFIIEAPYILELWLKQVPEWAVLFVRLVLFRQILSQMTVTLDTCIGATGNIKKFSIISMVIWMFPIVSGYVLLKLHYPIYTIYILLIIMVLFRTVNSIYFCNKQCGLNVKDYLLKVFCPCLALTIVMLALLYALQCILTEGWVRLFMVLFLGMVLFFMLDYLFVLDKTEKKNIVGIIKSLTNKLFNK